MIEAEAIWLLVKPINKKESLYTDAYDRKDLALNIKDSAGIDKAAEMPSRSKNTKMLDIKLIFPKNKYNTSSWSRSEIEFI